MVTTDISSLKDMQSGEFIVETGLSYNGLVPVCVRVTKREGRLEFSDHGGAVAAAGVDEQQLTFPSSIEVGEFSVNVSRRGVVSLPGFARSSDTWLEKLPELVAEGSIALYAALLELED